LNYDILFNQNRPEKEVNKGNSHWIGHQIEKALEEEDLPNLLRIYENKGLLALAAQHHLTQKKRDNFEGWLTRMMNNKERTPNLTATLKEVLPRIPETSFCKTSSSSS